MAAPESGDDADTDSDDEEEEKSLWEEEEEPRGGARCLDLLFKMGPS
jgi:hypothetical protein